MRKRTGTKQRSDDRTTNLSRLIMIDNLRIDLFGWPAAVRGQNVWWENQEILRSVEMIGGTITHSQEEPIRAASGQGWSKIYCLAVTTTIYCTVVLFLLLVSLKYLLLLFIVSRSKYLLLLPPIIYWNAAQPPSQPTTTRRINNDNDMQP